MTSFKNINESYRPQEMYWYNTNVDCIDIMVKM